MISGMRLIAMSALAVVAALSACGGPSCDTITDGFGNPSLTFTSVPARESTNYLQGVAMHVKPANFFVAVYIDVPGSGGWWTKPYFDNPRTGLHCDGRFTADITTGAHDSDATQIAAFLLPNNVNPPALAGSPTLPQSLYQSAVAVASVSR
jgi:hypothetical protein